NLGNRLDIVFYFSVSKENVVQRLSGRLICSDCGANYHKIYVTSSKDGICDKCGGKLNQRADDKPETVLERLRVYHEQTEGLIDYYTKSGILREISSDDTRIEMIARKISDTINDTMQEKSLIGRGVN
ncbi:MAG: nucleoside monophosphate kinase, partial [Planctomycetota bacterium]